MGPPRRRRDARSPRRVTARAAVSTEKETTVKLLLFDDFKLGVLRGDQVVDDSEITAKVKSALAGDPRTKAHQINIETRNGVVQLSGFVDTSEAKSTAEELARSVENVKSVDNEIDVKK